MNTKNNQRFLNTEKRLEQTFLALCQTTSPEKITVSQICKAVDINRSTFYDHYLDIPDLIQKIGIKYMREMSEIISNTNEKTSFPLTVPYLVNLFTYIEKHQEFFDIYFNHSNPKTLEMSFANFLEKSYQPYMERFHFENPEIIKYHFTFFKAGFIAILSRWVQYGCKEKPEEIANILLRNLPNILP